MICSVRSGEVYCCSPPFLHNALGRQKSKKKITVQTRDAGIRPASLVCKERKNKKEEIVESKRTVLSGLANGGHFRNGMEARRRVYQGVCEKHRAIPNALTVLGIKRLMPAVLR